MCGGYPGGRRYQAEAEENEHDPAHGLLLVELQ
jgi:hypothetical protein